jgi:hypothetical protein
MPRIVMLILICYGHKPIELISHGIIERKPFDRTCAKEQYKSVRISCGLAVIRTEYNITMPPVEFISSEARPVYLSKLNEKHYKIQVIIEILL